MRMANALAIVQQVLFTSAQTGDSAGDQIVAASSDLAENDRREMAAWRPWNDSLLDSGREAVSVNFFMLPSGSLCVSRTTPACREFSARGNLHVYTHCLIASPEVLRQFGNHPFRLLDAALASGNLRTWDKPPASLQTLELAQTAPADNAGLLAELVAQVGAASLAILVQAALSSVSLAVRGPVATTRLIRGLLDCLPVDCRTSISFSTALKFCPRQPFDVIALPDDPAQQSWLQTRPGLTTLDLGRDPASANLLVHNWARLIYRTLATENFTFLSEEMEKPRADFSIADLPVLGLQLLDEFDAGEIQQNQLGKTRQSHAAHHTFQKSCANSSQTDASLAGAPSELLDAESPEILAKLEALDDAVFDSIQGKTAALADLQKLWPELKSELGEALLAESREQYIRHALSIWKEPADIEGNHDPARAVNALEVLCVLFDAGG